MTYYLLSSLNVLLAETQNHKAYFQMHMVTKMGFFNALDSLDLEINWSTGIEVLNTCDAANRQKRAVRTSYWSTLLWSTIICLIVY